MKKFSRVIGVAAAAALMATGASADVTLPTAVPTGDVETWAGTILVGLTLIWGVRKLIGMTNKS
jgi:hypothetical protein